MQHLAELARLHIAAERLPLLRERLERIVAAFSTLADDGAAPDGETGRPQAPADAVAQAPPAAAPRADASAAPAAPAAPPAAGAPRLALRDDVAEAPLPLATVLANAPQCAGGAFVVPRVIDA